MENRSLDKRECLFCGASLSGRKDKKFCDDNCRNNYYYNANKGSNVSVKKTNSVLVHNRYVLSLLCRGTKTIVKKQILVDMGFDFELITSLYKTRRNDCYMVVYDFAYKIVDENVIIMKY